MVGCKKARLQKLLMGPPFVDFLVDTDMMKHKTLQKCPESQNTSYSGDNFFREVSIITN